MKTRVNPADGKTERDFSSITNEDLNVLLFEKTRTCFRVGDWNRETAIAVLEMLSKMNGD